MTKTRFARYAGLTVSALCAVTLLSGCGSNKQPPTEKLATAESLINTSRDTEARELIELRRAEDKLAQAKAAVASKDYETAERLADQALMDARLAEAKVQSIRARQATEDLRRSIETLRREINR
jgi:hypothetical protein